MSPHAFEVFTVGAQLRVRGQFVELSNTQKPRWSIVIHEGDDVVFNLLVNVSGRMVVRNAKVRGRPTKEPVVI